MVLIVKFKYFIFLKGIYKKEKAQPWGLRQKIHHSKYFNTASGDQMPLVI